MPTGVRTLSIRVQNVADLFCSTLAMNRPSPTIIKLLDFLSIFWHRDLVRSDSEMIVACSSIGALLIYGEHRYFGKSLPFGQNSWTNENIGYLTPGTDWINRFFSHSQSKLWLTMLTWLLSWNPRWLTPLIALCFRLVVRMVACLPPGSGMWQWSCYSASLTFPELSIRTLSWVAWLPLPRLDSKALACLLICLRKRRRKHSRLLNQLAVRWYYLFRFGITFSKIDCYDHYRDDGTGWGQTIWPCTVGQEAEAVLCSRKREWCCRRMHAANKFDFIFIVGCLLGDEWSHGYGDARLSLSNRLWNSSHGLASQLHLQQGNWIDWLNEAHYLTQ